MVCIWSAETARRVARLEAERKMDADVGPGKGGWERGLRGKRRYELGRAVDRWIVGLKSVGLNCSPSFMVYPRIQSLSEST